ncbi:uncharacterized protein TNCV_4020651 [Trichonephila clavipes]|nr:uncharacterized protein TNCV_4020651 [Trichonephila clavipes]
MHKEEKSFVRKKTTSKSSPKSDKKIVQIHQKLLPNLHQISHLHMGEYRAWKKTLQNTLLKSSLRDWKAIDTLLMTAQINTDFVNHPVPSTTKLSTSLVRVGTDACESIINSILRYKDYDFHKNAWPR